MIKKLSANLSFSLPTSLRLASNNETSFQLWEGFFFLIRYNSNRLLHLIWRTYSVALTDNVCLTKVITWPDKWGMFFTSLFYVLKQSVISYVLDGKLVFSLKFYTMRYGICSITFGYRSAEHSLLWSDCSTIRKDF